MFSTLLADLIHATLSEDISAAFSHTPIKQMISAFGPKGLLGESAPNTGSKSVTGVSQSNTHNIVNQVFNQHPAPQTLSSPTPFPTGLPTVPQRTGLSIGPSNASSQELPKLLQQILGVIQQIAGKLGVKQTAIPGTGQSGTAKYQFAQIAKQLQGIPLFRKFVPPSIAKTALSIPKLLGALGIGFSVGTTIGMTLNKLAIHLVKLPGELVQFAKGLTESNRDLAQWNGAITSSFIDLEMKTMQLDVRRAAAGQGGAGALNREIQGLMEDLQPLRESADQISNLFKTGVVQIIREVLSTRKILEGMFPVISAGVKAVEWLAGWFEDQNKIDAGGDMLRGALRALQNPGNPPNRPVVKPVQNPPNWLVPPLINPINKKPIK